MIGSSSTWARSSVRARTDHPVLPLIPILLVLGVLLADSGLLLDIGLASEPGSSTTAVVLLSTVPTGLVVIVCIAALAMLHSRMGGEGDRRLGGILRTGDRCMVVARWVVLLNYLVAVLMLDWLGAMREFTGTMLLVDELLVMLPPVLAITCLWWAWYPIERRLHEVALLQRLDRGLPVHLPPGRWPYVLSQLRLHVLLMLVPMLLILAVSEGLERWLAPEGTSPGAVNLWLEVGTGASALLVLGLSPWIARALLGLRTLPAGEVRQDMQAICDRHRVRARDIMLWRTGGTMINAAVMGFVPQLRYLVLTDGLLEQVPRPQVLAVMAHEVGHVRHRHMPWLLVCLFATVAVSQWCLELLFWIEPAMFMESRGGGALLQVVVLLAVVFILFGWISRRFERQADTFAVQHLTRLQPNREEITPSSVEAMSDALGSIAALQAVDPGRRSWRHGSIAWRCGYLHTLVGQHAGQLVIDRVMVAIRLASSIIIVLAILQLILDGAT
jgi:STE24 endopeptidase